MDGRMHLVVLLPHGVFVDVPGVCRIVAETPQGAFGLWPRRLDCVASLVPGILTYETETGGPVFVAVEAGVLVKTGAAVQASVRRAIAGDLQELHATVEREFATQDDAQRSARTAMARVEADLMRRFVGLAMTDDAAQRDNPRAAEPAVPRAAAASTLAAGIDARVRRKLRARRLGAPVVWSGLGVMGMVGWSVVVPTLLGVLLGGWLDRHHAGGHAWTLPLLVAGLVIGCASAGFWVLKEQQAMRDEQARAND